MKRLNTLSEKKQLEVVFATEELRNKLDNWAYTCESDYVDDKLNCFEHGAIDYELGVCAPRWMKVKDTWDAFKGMKESVECFGGSERMQKSLKQAEKLYSTNLWEWMVAKCLEIYFEEEIETSYKWMEDISYAIYCEDSEKFMELGGDSIWDSFMANDFLSDYLYEKGTVYADYRAVS